MIIINTGGILNIRFAGGSRSRRTTDLAFFGALAETRPF
jgi:hypothetical protein